MLLRRLWRGVCALAALVIASSAQADQPWTFGNNTKVVALGDSLTAGHGATPVTNGYAYLLYQQGVYDSMTNTSFADIAMPGATSQQVLLFQIPMALGTGFLATQPNSPQQVVILTVGGNDLLTIFPAIVSGGDPATVVKTVLGKFGANLTGALAQLCTLPNTRIYVGNLYDIQNFPQLVPNQPPVSAVIDAFNLTLASVVGGAHAQGCAVKVADVHAAFSGSQQGLLLINRQGAAIDEIHPTNAGYRAMAQAFIAAK